MKRFVSFLLAVTMLASMGSNAYGEGPESSKERISGLSGSATIDVNGSYEAGEGAEAAYYVTVDWGDMTFTYDYAGQLTWNTSDLKYVNELNYDWKSYQNDITVANRSNAPITVKAEATASNDNHGITPVISGTDSFTLPAGIEGHPNSPYNNKFSVQVTYSGRPDPNLSGQSFTAGTVTLTFAAAGEGPQG